MKALAHGAAHKASRDAASRILVMNLEAGLESSAKGSESKGNLTLEPKRT